LGDGVIESALPRPPAIRVLLKNHPNAKACGSQIARESQRPDQEIRLAMNAQATIIMAVRTVD
jgi:hypothetical protein